MTTPDPPGLLGHIARQMSAEDAETERAFDAAVTPPVHGQKGDFAVYDNVSGNVHTRCVGTKRWCAKCRDWVGGKGPVSMVMAAVGCPRCFTRWDAEQQVSQ